MRNRQPGRLETVAAKANQQVNVSGKLLLVLMLLCGGIAVLHHPATPDTASTRELPANPTDALATVPHRIREVLGVAKYPAFGERMALMTKIEAAGALEVVLNACTLPAVEAGNIADWAKANVTNGITRGAITADEVQTWYAQGKQLEEQALLTPSLALCQQYEHDLNATGPARYLETRGINGTLIHRSATTRAPAAPAVRLP